LYCCIAMAIEIVVDLPAFFVVVDSVVRHNDKLKTMLWSIYTKTELGYCSYSFYEPIRIIWALAIDDECRFGHHL
jgi:hypothetical protein